MALSALSAAVTLTGKIETGEMSRKFEDIRYQKPKYREYLDPEENCFFIYEKIGKERGEVRNGGF